MRSYFFHLLLIIPLFSPLNARSQFNRSSLNDDQLKLIDAPKELSKSQIESLSKGEVISETRVKSKDNIQNLYLWVSALHPQKCSRALKKVAHYEGYPQFLDFIKRSEYNDATNKWNLKIDHLLMPFPMYLNFKLPRVNKPGAYPFTFDQGFLKDLQGKITAREIGDRCQLSLLSQWEGPKSKIPDIVFSTFVQTLSELGLQHLIRATRL